VVTGYILLLTTIELWLKLSCNHRYSHCSDNNPQTYSDGLRWYTSGLNKPTLSRVSQSVKIEIYD